VHIVTAVKFCIGRNNEVMRHDVRSLGGERRMDIQVKQAGNE